MNYKDELMLQINEIWQELNKVGLTTSANSVAAAADSATTVTELMAAADYAMWHFQQIDV